MLGYVQLVSFGSELDKGPLLHAPVFAYLAHCCTMNREPWNCRVKVIDGF